MTKTLQSVTDSRTAETRGGDSCPASCSASFSRASVILADCMDVMSKLADGAYDLAICDPPYGIGEGDGRCRTRLKHNNLVKHAPKSWDDERPAPEYWNELRRVSKHQIIWGANYFTQHLPPSMGWVFWDKRIGGDFSDGELAYTSFDRALQKVTLWNGNNGVARIHPVQKPVNLYAWLLREYAQPGWRILDTHMGSGSSVIAAVQAGFEMLACEKDEEYFATAVERIGRELQQGVLV